jgi:glycosyltransferase involved in cell wall biosynthesis
VSSEAVVAVSPYGIDGASSRVRLHEWFDHTAVPVEFHSYLGTSNNGVGTVARRLPQAIAAEMGLRSLSRRVADRTVILSREASPFTSGGLESSILRRAGRGVYDFDDALYADDASSLSSIWSKKKTWERSVRAADVVIAGSDILADAATALSESVVMVPSCIDPDDYLVKRDYSLGEVPRAGWSGSPATEAFLVQIADALLTLHERHGLRVTVISGGDADLGPLAAMADRVTWRRDGFGAELRRADFGLMPLPDTPYTRGKCSYKLLQYAAAGLPLVGSPVGANETVLARLGGLAATTTDEWIDAASSLLEAGETTRAATGASMRSGVVADFSYARWTSTWLGALDLADRA